MGDVTVSSAVDSFMRASGQLEMRQALGIGNALSSSRIVILSQSVTLDSDIDSGGGTDCTADVQAILDTATAAAPLTLIVDGVGLLTTTLVVKSHTHIRVLLNCGFYLTDNSNCHILTNTLSGSSITATDIVIEGHGIWNCGSQDKYQGGTNLNSYTTSGGGSITSGSNIVTYPTDPGYGTNYARVCVGMHVTSDHAGIPTDTYIQSISDATHAVMTANATASNSGNNFAFTAGPYDRFLSLNYGFWFAGFDGLTIRGVTVRNAPTFSMMLNNGRNFLISDCRALWDDQNGPSTVPGGATTSSSATITYTADPGYGTGSALVQVGQNITGPGIPYNTTISAITNNHQATLDKNATATASGLTFSTMFLTNHNRDGVHLLGDLDNGAINHFRTNGDDSPVALDADNGIQYADSRRGTGHTISNISVDDLCLDYGVQGFLLHSANGVGVIKNARFRNIHGTLVSDQFPVGKTVAGHTYLGRFGADSALASVDSITVEGWNLTPVFVATGGLTAYHATEANIRGVPDALAIDAIGVENYHGDRAPTWQRFGLHTATMVTATDVGGTLPGYGTVGYGKLNLQVTATDQSYVSAGLAGLVVDSFSSDIGHMDYGNTDWSAPMEAEVSFRLAPSADANVKFRFQIGRAEGSTGSPGVFTSAFSGIGFAVENYELYLITAVGGTLYHLDTGAAIADTLLQTVRLRNLGDGVVRVYLNDVLVYSCTSDKGPTAHGLGMVTEFQLVNDGGGSGGGFVIVHSLRIKRDEQTHQP